VGRAETCVTQVIFTCHTKKTKKMKTKMAGYAAAVGIGSDACGLHDVTSVYGM
jgi:hydrogenase maturation factor